MLEQILRARHHLSLGQLDAAETLVKENASEPEALHILGVIELRRGQPQAAEGWLRRAIERDAGVAEYHNDLGNALQDRGRLAEAIACYRRALRLHPGFAEAWNDLGTARYAKGELEAALECYRQALRLRPDHLVAHANLGAVCRKLGLLGEARRAFQRELVLRLKQALRALLPKRPDFAAEALAAGNTQLAVKIAQLDPDNKKALRVLSAAYLRQAKFEPALDAARRSGDALTLARALAAGGKADELDEVLKEVPGALERGAQAAPLHVALGDGLRRKREAARAEVAYRRALELDPMHLMARVRLSELLHETGRLDEAEAAARAALELDDEAAAAHAVLGMARKAKGRAKQALECFERAVELNPRHVQATRQLVQALRDEERLEEAERRLRAALRARPDHPVLLADLGMILADQMRHEEAAALFDRALELAPQSVIALNGKALLLEHLGRREAGLALLREALRRAPHDDHTRYNLGLQHLKYGELAEGWEGYERRRSFENFIGRYRRFALPQWEGEALEGRVVLVLPEQGLGDEIMFGSCVPDLAREARHVIIECDPKLETIFRRSFAGSTVVSRQRTVANDWITRVEPKPELQLAAGSLARRYRRNASDFPQQPFLRADAESVQAWKKKLAALGPGRKIGLSWRGGVAATGRKRRSFTLEELVPILRLPDVQFVNLQYTDVSEELRQLEGRYSLKVHHWQEAIDDYDQTAALVAALDGVLTVCTAIVHLSGGLGRPALVMVPFGADWRYGGVGERMLWYPSHRLLRQRKVAQWREVLEEVAGRIRGAAWP